MNNFKLNVLHALNNSFVYRYLAYRVHRRTCLKNPVAEISRGFYTNYGRNPDLDNPRHLIEKISWMELHCDVSEWTLCADKYRMRGYVEAGGCGQDLPKLYGKWDTPKQIVWDELPAQFVLKANNGCGTVLVVKDKSQFKEKSVKRMLQKWLAIPYGYRGYQRHYLDIKPCVIAEELLIQDKELDRISPQSMVDFKVWCFDGKVESIFVAYNRKPASLSCDLYDAEWNHLTGYLKEAGHYHTHPEVEFPRPSCLEEMKSVASALSKGHPQMRVDFYVVSGKPVVGELTMATGYGYFTEDYYYYLGSLIDLSMMKVIDGTPIPNRKG